MHTVVEAGHQAFFMFWETLWALVLGFVLSGLVQAYVSRSKMQSVLGDHGPGAIGRSTFFGIVSSSCSYAAAALAKTLFSRGADFTAAMVFMLASTNLVVELGLVLWLLLGWQFALAEFVGGFVMVVLMAFVLPRVIPARLIDEARTRLNAQQATTHAGHGHHEHDHSNHGEPGAPETRGNLRDAASYTIADLTMLRKELVIGFVVAGVMAAAVPTSVWQALFLNGPSSTGHGWISAVENAIVGPFLAIISFVCSVGNVPLAAALWTGGIGFGGVIAFVFADLITLPLLVIYRKYYGTAITLRLLGALWAIMTVAGLVVEGLFTWWGMVPERRAGFASMELAWDHTTYLNIVGIIVLIAVVVLARRRRESSTYAIDPICGMQVEIAHAPAVRQGADGPVYFCADRCAERWTTGSGSAPTVAPPALLQIGRRPDSPDESGGSDDQNRAANGGDCCGHA